MDEGNSQARDILSMLLKDELYKDDPERMVDESITFMFAAT